jgi:hypothetical protein
MPAAPATGDIEPSAGLLLKAGSAYEALHHAAALPRAESRRFLKKRRKNFWWRWACGVETARAQFNKVFLLLFVHKK